MGLRIKKHGVLLIVLAASGVVMAQSAIDRLGPLVATSAERLQLADQVALAKWDSGAPVEDAPREGQVIAAAVKAGEAMGLDGASVSHFFGAQIEANKMVQYSLLADWRRAGRAPAHAPVDLARLVRPELDALQAGLISELTDTSAVRADASCRVNVAKAVGRYVALHKRTSRLQMIALDRAMSGACGS